MKPKKECLVIVFSAVVAENRIEVVNKVTKIPQTSFQSHGGLLNVVYDLHTQKRNK